MAARHRIITDAPLTKEDLYNAFIAVKEKSTFLGTDSGNKGSSNVVKKESQMTPQRVKKMKKIDRE